MGPPRLRADGMPDGHRQVIPTLYCPWERLDKSDELLVAFAALAVAQESRFLVTAAGRIVNGEQFRLKRINIVPLLSKAREAIDAIVAFAESPTPPGPVLNAHCPACEYQSRCRSIAIERDDLSLLGAITSKERRKSEIKASRRSRSCLTVTGRGGGDDRNRRRDEPSCKPGTITS